VDGINPYGWTRGEHHRPLPTKLSPHPPQPTVDRVETPVLWPTIKAMDPISHNPPPWAWPSAYSNQNARVCVDTPTQHLELLQQRQQISHNSVPTKHAIWPAWHLCSTWQTPTPHPKQDLSHYQSRATNQAPKSTSKPGYNKPNHTYKPNSKSWPNNSEFKTKTFEFFLIH